MMNVLNTGFEAYSNGDLVNKANLIINELSNPPASGYYQTITLAPDVISAEEAFSADIALGNAPGAAEARDNTREALILAMQALA